MALPPVLAHVPLETPAVADHNLDAVLHLAATNRLNDAAEIEHEIGGPAVAINGCRSARRGNTRKRLRITVESRTDLAEEAKMIAANAALEAYEALQDCASIVWPGESGTAREVQHVAIEIKHAKKAIRGITAVAWLGAHIVCQTFPRNHHGAEERAELPIAWDLVFRLILDECARPVRYPKAEPSRVIDLSGKRGRATASVGCGIRRHAIGITFDLGAQNPARRRVILNPATEIEHEIRSRLIDIGE